MALITPQHVQALLEHEWSYKQDLSTLYCETCGAQKRHVKGQKAPGPKHKPSCAYAELLRMLLTLNTHA